MPPKITPSVAEMATTINPMHSDTRPPYINRVSMSMPFLSVPSGCALEGKEYASNTRVTVPSLMDHWYLSGLYSNCTSRTSPFSFVYLRLVSPLSTAAMTASLNSLEMSVPATLDWMT